jgi:MoaA/NifB/PqqE/SkfB family radical SAM enzyme
MPKINSNFCIAPFIQLQISNNGNTGPCPYTANMWQFKNEKTIKEKWQSKTLENFRESFLKNEKNKLCNRCWTEEDAGKLSLRTRLNVFKNSTNLQKKVFQKYIDKKEYLKYPKIITLIPGNECNLACPTCGPKFSSKWNSLIKNGNYENLQLDKNYNLSDQEYQDIVDNSEQIQKIELFGGEPFYNKKKK